MYLLFWCADGLDLLYEWLVLLVLDITLATEAFEGLLVITFLDALGKLFDRWFMSNPAE